MKLHGNFFDNSPVYSIFIVFRSLDKYSYQRMKNIPVEDDFMDTYRLAYVLRVVVFIIPVLVLTGWQLDIAIFKTVYPGYVAMNPLTAILFIMAGVSLYLVQDKKSAKKLNIARYIGLMIMIIAAIKMIGFNAGLDLEIDKILFAEDLAGNRMAPNTTLNFLLVGLSILCIDFKKERKYICSQFIALTALLISLFAIIGYMYGSVSLYRFTIFVPMAVHAAANFVVLTCAILLTRFKTGFVSVIFSRNIGGSILRKILPICLCTPVIVGWLRMKAISHDIFTPEFSSALAAVVMITIFSRLLWRLAVSLNKTDAARKAVELKLTLAKTVAEDAEKMQEQFLANMSHEIRTPLNGIRGMTTLLMDTRLDVEQRDFANTIKYSSDNLIVIINDILDFSKIKAGKLNLEEIDFSLHEVLANTSKVFKHRLSEKHLFFKISKAEDVPDGINGDPNRLSQILINLLGNAIKFTHVGGIKLHIDVKERNADQVCIRFAITDTGIGIEEAKLESIFESFQQGSIETSRKYGGTGLGLAITKNLVTLQHGLIEVKSEINKGTTFVFSIPYSTCKSDAFVFSKAKDPDAYIGIFVDKRFLVVEDNVVNQKVISKVLQKAGSFVDIANNGLEAIERLKQQTYDLIIMDLQMPEMDGYATSRYIRKELNLKLPIIAMTASALKGEKEKCIAMGMNDYVTKPFEFSFIYDRIRFLLSETSSGAPLEPAPEKKEYFDISLLIAMEDDDFTLEIISMFLSSTPDDIACMQKMNKEFNYDGVNKLAHKLKSTAGVLQAFDLLHNLTEIEKSIHENSTERLTYLLEASMGHYKKMEQPLIDLVQTMSEKQTLLQPKSFFK